MKRLLTLALLALTSCAIFSADVRLAWDFNAPEDEVTAYRIYEVGSTTNLVATVPGTENTVTISGVTPGRRIYVATAVNYWGESGFSNEAKTPPPGQAPKNVKTTQ